LSYVKLTRTLIVDFIADYLSPIFYRHFFIVGFLSSLFYRRFFIVTFLSSPFIATIYRYFLSLLFFRYF